MDKGPYGARDDERRPQTASARLPQGQGVAQSSGSSPDTSRYRVGPYRPGKLPARVTATRPGEDRYRHGSRRTGQEPLSASWHPAARPAGEKRPDRSSSRSADSPSRRRGKAAKLVSTYGWRAYAVPVLIVLTVLIVVNTANSPAQPILANQPALSAATAGGASSKSGPDGDAGDPSPALLENPAQPVDLRIPTAELPEGTAFSQAGQGLYHLVPGKGDKVGTGRLYTYTIEVENGIDPASYAGDDSFASAVQGTLSDPQSWTWDGKIALQRVDAGFPNPSFRVTLMTPETAHRPDFCGYQIRAEASCYRRNIGRVVLNLARWVRGAKAFSSDLGLYRQYAINHEVGHALGGQHVGCTQNGALAPVMMQQTFGVANDYVAKLNDVPGGDKGRVTPDGNICRPNAWPNPVGR